ncbi:hypothetical protein SDRG_10752 [Saprolegnia diclina VS20]|uniref:Myb-like domain-containing protein n=1 Tax=Saprolegnia diclina (strain VS20) TaxID=1156394 RepID=T0RNJ9_SAPDV|nr:hypothetical protein SDRG_10752 [Saprolegnia diclina VS20]EQC31582.1 hypothetical protein SDRG_10752 [Saprolegnia diclina VS20]|eukprot:XP_008614981.1 hypothetical protein SDRG_10752 [Saprolegnia diclina VS20]
MAVALFGSNWKVVADNVAAACPLLPPRSPKKCRDRWVGYLRPDINWGEFTGDESAMLQQLVLTPGVRWVDIIEIYMPTRTVALLKKQCKKLKLRCCMSPGRRRSF